jgi:folate-dependent phosphoribosylglycinamide formyltransferase PurN
VTPGRVVLLAGDGPASRIVWNALRARFADVHAIVEEPPRRADLLRRRVKRLGAVTVAGQLGFQLAVQPWLRRGGQARIRQIMREHGLDASPFTDAVHRVPSVNGGEARELLRSLAPSVVVVNGTRIIGRETLAAIACPVLNTHAGITPLYRGVHGGYWALAEGRPELAGTTVHFVDEGIDTGRIVDQAFIQPTREDTFATYPYLHVAAGLSILLPAVERALAGTLEPRPAPAGDALPSRLRTHPTLWGYLAGRLRGVR